MVFLFLFGVSILAAVSGICQEKEPGLVIIEATSIPLDSATQVDDAQNSGWNASTKYPGFTGPHALAWQGKEYFGSPPAVGGELAYQFEVAEAGLYTVTLWNRKGDQNDGRTDLYNDVWFKVNENLDGEFHKFFTNQKVPPKWSFRMTWEHYRDSEKFSAPEVELNPGVNTVRIKGRSDDFHLSQIRVAKKSPEPANWDDETIPAPVGDCSSNAVAMSTASPQPDATPIPGASPTAPPTAPAGTLVSSISLINANDGSEISLVSNGFVLVLDPNQSYNFRANCGDATGSVTFSLTGPGPAVTKTESVAPFALFGDSGGNYNAWDSPAVGQYTLEATAFSAANAEGQAGPGFTVTFAVAPEGSPTPQPSLQPESSEPASSTSSIENPLSSSDGEVASSGRHGQSISAAFLLVILALTNFF